MNVLGRRARQMRNGYSHLARMGRPIYPSTAQSSVAASIEAERRKAARAAASKKKSK